MPRQIEANWPYLEEGSPEAERRKIWLGDLAEFIVEANLQTWAADKGEVKPTKPGFKRHKYARGEWGLDDEYSGYFRAPGMTVVSYKDRAVWGMQYGGQGMWYGQEYIAKETFAFLRKALKKVTREMPYRGPAEYKANGWRYRFKLEPGSGIESFKAKEYVAGPLGGLVFEQDVMGGIVIGKDENGRAVYPWNL